MKGYLLVGIISLILILCGGFSSKKQENPPLKMAYMDWPGDYFLVLFRDFILQTAIKELGRVLYADEAMIELHLGEEQK